MDFSKVKQQGSATSQIVNRNTTKNVDRGLFNEEPTIAIPASNTSGITKKFDSVNDAKQHYGVKFLDLRPPKDEYKGEKVNAKCISIWGSATSKEIGFNPIGWCSETVTNYFPTLEALADAVVNHYGEEIIFEVDTRFDGGKLHLVMVGGAAEGVVI